MRFLLDTTVCVDYLRGRQPVVHRIRSCEPEELVLSTVVVAELRFGADNSTDPSRNHALLDTLLQEISPLDFDLAAATTFGKVRAALAKRGQLIGPYDMMIAAHALSLDLVLVTDNLQEFRRVDGLRVESWPPRWTTRA